MTSNDFSYQDWNGCDHKNQDLSHYILTGTQINGSDLRGCILNGAKLQNAQLCGTDLTNASLRGADLRDANLQYTKLSGVNLSGANVQGTLFKGSTGLTEETKRELKTRDAIFDDSVPRTTNLKWWIQYVLIPLITLLLGSSGIVGVLEYLKKQSSTSPIPSPTVQPVTPSSPSTKPTPTTKPTGEPKRI
ncbi:MAG: pentapeptide repeat-containing protein [Scytonema sp. PMC 1069.18]|nr:pentapeptide repeat-containing protein [Scytonema sp. PMC 1069.18]MEC4880942.1 pentapeptide repeat-containing protein [Scytonema sp. PMC 1070.18]